MLPSVVSSLLEKHIPQDGPPFIKGAAIAAVLGVCATTVHKMSKRGLLPPPVKLSIRAHLYPADATREALRVLLTGGAQ
jgi:hypothetical protein